MEKLFIVMETQILENFDPRADDKPLKSSNEAWPTVSTDLLLVLVLLGSVLQNSSELDVVEQLVLNWRFAIHFVDLGKTIFKLYFILTL